MNSKSQFTLHFNRFTKAINNPMIDRIILQVYFYGFMVYAYFGSLFCYYLVSSVFLLGTKNPAAYSLANLLIGTALFHGTAYMFYRKSKSKRLFYSNLVLGGVTVTGIILHVLFI